MGGEDDDSDEDIGKQNIATDNDITLNYDSDEKADDDLIDTMTSELADFGSFPDDSNKAATNIPKLSGPK
jgi:hypothetical protein